MQQEKRTKLEYVYLLSVYDFESDDGFDRIIAVGTDVTDLGVCLAGEAERDAKCRKTFAKCMARDAKYNDEEVKSDYDAEFDASGSPTYVVVRLPVGQSFSFDYESMVDVSNKDMAHFSGGYQALKTFLSA